jgi:small subunit ribosomal protein S5
MAEYNTKTSAGGSSEYVETVVIVNRVSKVVKGGKRFSFSSVVVVGDKKGNVGAAIGKANEVQSSIQKAVAKASKNMIKISLLGNTIPHEIIGNFCASRVVMKPASPGTGVIAGGPVRAVLEAVGIRDVLTKSQKSRNAMNVVFATLEGLKKLRLKKDIAELRGKKVEDL